MPRGIDAGALLLTGLLVVCAGCGLDDDSCETTLAFVGANFNPILGANAFEGLSETSQAVAQTFTVPSYADEPVVEVLLALTQGPSSDSGVIRLDLRPTDSMGAPSVDGSSAFAAVLIDTSSLPPLMTDGFTSIAINPVSLSPGATYAIVVEFVSRSGSTDTLDIAVVAGVDGSAGDLYPEGSGFTGVPGVVFSDSGDDYFFSTTLLLCLDWY